MGEILDSIFGSKMNADNYYRLVSGNNTREREEIVVVGGQENRSQLPVLQEDIIIARESLIEAYQQGYLTNKHAIEYVQREGLSFYKKMRRADTHLASLCRKTLSNIASVPSTILPGVTKDPQEQEHQAMLVDFLYEALDQFDYNDALIQIGDAFLSGFSVSQILWSKEPFIFNGKKKLSFDRIELVEPENFVIGAGRQIRFLTEQDPVKGVELDWTQKIITMFYGSGAYGDGMLNYVFPAWWFKRNSGLYFAKFQERYANPALVGFYKNKGDSADVVQMLNGIRSSGVAALPEAKEIIQIEAKSQHDFISGFNYFDDQMSRYFTGGDLSVGHAGGRGNMGAAKIHQEGFDTLVLSGAQSLSRIVNKQIIKALIDVNFTPQKLYPFTVPGEDVVDTPESYVNRIVALGGIPGMELEISKQELYEKGGITKPSDEIDTVVIGGAGSMPGQVNFHQGGTGSEQVTLSNLPISPVGLRRTSTARRFKNSRVLKRMQSRS